MPTIPRPSDLIRCSDLSSCFQALYNFLFAFLVAFAFIYFLYGAIEYLGSAAYITKREKGKNRMINAILGLVIAMIIPILLNMISPEIFRIKWEVPRIEGLPHNVYEELNLNSVVLNKRALASTRYKDFICSPSNEENYNKYAKNKYNDVIVNYGCSQLRKEVVEALEECVKEKARFIVSPGGGYKYYNVCENKYYHASGDKCHLEYGNCVDLVPERGESYENLMSALTDCGFHVLNESLKDLPCNDGSFAKNCFICASTGPHLHAILDLN